MITTISIIIIVTIITIIIVIIAIFIVAYRCYGRLRVFGDLTVTIRVIIYHYAHLGF